VSPYIDYQKIYRERIERADRRMAAAIWFCVGAMAGILYMVIR